MIEGPTPVQPPFTADLPCWIVEPLVCDLDVSVPQTLWSLLSRRSDNRPLPRAPGRSDLADHRLASCEKP